MNLTLCCHQIVTLMFLVIIKSLDEKVMSLNKFTSVALSNNLFTEES